MGSPGGPKAHLAQRQRQRQRGGVEVPGYAGTKGVQAGARRTLDSSGLSYRAFRIQYARCASTDLFQSILPSSGALSLLSASLTWPTL